MADPLQKAVFEAVLGEVDARREGEPLDATLRRRNEAVHKVKLSAGLAGVSVLETRRLERAMHNLLGEPALREHLAALLRGDVT